MRILLKGGRVERLSGRCDIGLGRWGTWRRILGVKSGKVVEIRRD
jgi:hypothetical protein